MAGRKRQLAQIMAVTGLTRTLELLPRRPSLLILNYHRIGDAQLTAFDSGVFSCTGDALERQVELLQARYDLLPLETAVEVLLGTRPLRKPAVLLTFDDGYLDNYELAFPVLRRRGAPAAFFLPTAFVGTSEVPWWDAIAYVMKACRRPSVELTLPAPVTLDLAPGQRGRSIHRLLELYKEAKELQLESLLAHLEERCGTARPGNGAERLFLSWDEARAMQAAGMSFGSHTHTHRILAGLPFAEQKEELVRSRAILERELGGTVDTLAYPVGGTGTFNEETRRAVEEAGYRCGFSFTAGTNLPGRVDRHAILRTGVYADSRSVLRLRMMRHLIGAGLAGAGSRA